MVAAFVARYQPRPDDPHKHWFYLGGVSVVWCVWQLANAAGVLAGSLIPASWSLEFASTLSLIALTIPLLYDRAVVCGAIAAGLVALVARPLPMNLGIVVSVAAGVSVGLAVAPFVQTSRVRGAK
jgi:predicted branched-subunit amino acid permease